jgi:hypothetical protein
MANNNSDEKEKARKLLTPEKRIEEQKALQKAKELEKEEIPTAKEEMEEVEEFMEESEEAKKLLKPAWYLKKTKKRKSK